MTDVSNQVPEDLSCVVCREAWVATDKDAEKWWMARRVDQPNDEYSKCICPFCFELLKQKVHH